MDNVEFTEEEMWGFEEQPSETIPYNHSDTTELTEDDADDDGEEMFMGRGRRILDAEKENSEEQTFTQNFGSAKRTIPLPAKSPVEPFGDSEAQSIKQRHMACSLPIAVPHMQMYLNKHEKALLPELPADSMDSFGEFDILEANLPKNRRMTTESTDSEDNGLVAPHVYASSVQVHSKFAMHFARKNGEIAGSYKGRNAIRARDTILRQTGFIDSTLKVIT